MSQIVKTEKKTIDAIVSTRTICDKCGVDIKTTRFNVFESNFTFHTGDSYPEGGSGEELELDFCEKCGREIMELFKNIGIKTELKDWDW